MTALLRAEILKVRTTKMWWGLLAGACALTAFQGLITALTAGLDPGAGQARTPTLADPAMVRTIYGSGFIGAHVIVLVLGIIGMSGEWRHRTITPTFLATPRRSRVLVAKLTTYGVLGLIYGAATTVTAVVLGAPIIATKGYDLRLTTDAVPQTLALSVLGMGVWAVFGLGLGTLVRSQVAAILIGVGFTILIEPLVTFGLSTIDLAYLAKYLPGNASSAIVQSVSAIKGLDLLPWWGGSLLLLVYGGVFAALGAVLTLRRDIT